MYELNNVIAVYFIIAYWRMDNIWNVSW